MAHFCRHRPLYVFQYFRTHLSLLSGNMPSRTFELFVHRMVPLPAHGTHAEVGCTYRQRTLVIQYRNKYIRAGRMWRTRKDLTLVV